MTLSIPSASRVATLLVRAEDRSVVLTVWESQEDIPRYWGEVRAASGERVIGPRYSIDSLEAEARELIQSA